MYLCPELFEEDFRVLYWLTGYFRFARTLSSFRIKSTQITELRRNCQKFESNKFIIIALVSHSRRDKK